MAPERRPGRPAAGAHRARSPAGAGSRGPPQGPLPPEDLAGRPLPLETRTAGSSLFRIHDAEREAVWFGPGSGNDPRSRFDDPACPACGFGVCYVAVTPEGAFAESFLREVPARVASRAFLDRHRITRLRTTRPLRLASGHGAGLARVGATAVIASGGHDLARRWARAIWAHQDAVDGLIYHCRHDDDELAIALFDRARDTIVGEQSRGLRDDRKWLGGVLERYQLALVD